MGHNHLFLKEIRERLGHSPQEVSLGTNIDLALLYGVENGEYLPTKEQIAALYTFYSKNADTILIDRLDEMFDELPDKSLGIATIHVAEQQQLYGQSLFADINTERLIAPESRRYIGSKTKLRDWIMGTILSETEQVSSLIDMFAGTASIARAAMQYCSRVVINDILYANNIVYKAFFEIGPCDFKKIERMVQTYNTIDSKDLPDNYFSENFGGKFFDMQNAKLIGFIREDLESQKNNLTEKEFCILLTILIYNMDRIANTVGHFDAYIKKPIKYQRLYLRLIEPLDFAGVEIYRENANILAGKIQADICYIDPPYNSRQYNRFYHIYENLVTWRKPKLYGVALKPKPENSSEYCTVKAKKALFDLVSHLNVRYIAVSYNNTYNSKSSSSENKIKLEEIEFILQQRGETKIFESSHRFFNTGKTTFEDHKELLFITKVK